MDIIGIVIGGILLFQLTWVAYLAVMNLKRNQSRLTPAAKIFGYPLLAVGYLLDTAFNLLVGTVIFLQLPEELLFTSRLGRNLRHPGGWRFDLALWFCTQLLDPFDPDGHHCSRPGTVREIDPDG